MAKKASLSESIEPTGVFVYVLYCRSSAGSVGEVLTHVVQLLRDLRLNVEHWNGHGRYRNPKVVYGKGSVDVTPSWDFKGLVDDVLHRNMNQELLASFRSVCAEAHVPDSPRRQRADWTFTIDEQEAKGALAQVVLCIPGTSAPLGGRAALQDALLDATNKIGAIWPIHFGFAELEEVEFSDFGASYMVDFLEPVSRRFAIEDRVWRGHPHERDPRARGVYWMNAWGHEIAQRALQRGDLLDQFSKWAFVNALEKHVPHTGRVEEAAGGSVVVFLTDDAGVCCDESVSSRSLVGRGGWVTSLLCWMHVALRDRGLLI